MEEKKYNLHPNSRANLKPIQKGEVRNPNGRPKNMIKRVIDEIGDLIDVKLSKTDVMNISSWVNQMTVAEITQVAMNRDSPGFIAVIANAILGDIKNGEMKNTQIMLEFQHGKANQQIAVETTIKEDILDPRLLTDAQIRKRLSELRERDIDEGTFEEIV